jgi:acyl transferase domain-containing protein/acyl carrier protein
MENDQRDLLAGNDVAIVGMSLRLPGANTPGEYWQNLAAGVESISFFSEQCLLEAGVPDHLVRNAAYVRARGMLPFVEGFDATLFGFTPREAEVLDPQQRMFLECAWEALECCGCNPEAYAGEIGVFAGTGPNRYILDLLRDERTLGRTGAFQLALANDKDFVATRASYKLNLCGPSLTVQSACSTSLVAVHLACSSLLAGECDMALAGSVSVRCRLPQGYLYEEGGVSSPDGHCRAFSKHAAGTVPSDGAGVVALKRLADALADGDEIWAVIRGSAINNDGGFRAGYTAPAIEGQAQVISEALAVAGVGPADISLIEGHGSGTPLGDRVELAALRQAFQAGTSLSRFCALGSVKSNIGHVDTAAGMAGLLKVVLALRHRVLPPSLHCGEPNPDLAVDGTPFYLNATPAAWNSAGVPRRAGVSSFGIGGTNVHIVLEEAPARPQRDRDCSPQILVLSAATESALKKIDSNLAEFLKHNEDVSLEDVAYTLQVGRRPLHQRRFAIAENVQQGARILSGDDTGAAFTASPREETLTVAFMFPGTGSQYPGMARGIYRALPAFRVHIDRCAELFLPLLGQDIRDHFQSETEAPPATGAMETRLSWALLFSVEFALARTLLDLGIAPRGLIGHSFGEYAAACIGGALSLEDAVQLVVLRTDLFRMLPPGAMLYASSSQQELAKMLPQDVSIAAVNGPMSCTASGTPSGIAELEERLQASGIHSRRVNIQVAPHSAMTEPILERFAARINAIRMQNPSIPFISNASGTWVRREQIADPLYWARHLRHAVLFQQGIETLTHGESGTLLEVGPGNTLSFLATPCLGPDPAFGAYTSMRHPMQDEADEAAFLKALGHLWLEGHSIRWDKLHQDARPHRIPLPLYPFEKLPYWVDSRVAETEAPTRPAGRSELKDCFYLPQWRPALAAAGDSAQGRSSRRWLVFMDELGLGQRLVESLANDGQQVVSIVPGDSCSRLNARTFQIRPQHEEDYDYLVKTLRGADLVPQHVLHLWSVTRPSLSSGHQKFEELQWLGFYSVLFLCKALDRESLYKPIRLLAAANRMHDLTAGADVEPEKATLLAVGRVAQQEYPNLRFASLDVGSGALDGRFLVQRILAEAGAASPERTVAYLGSRRYVETYQPVPISPDAPLLRSLRDGGVYLITGGFGNIGLRLAEYLFAACKARLVLVGRRALPPRKEWDAILKEIPAPSEMAGTLRALLALEEKGTQMMFLSADVAEREDMEKVFQSAEANFGSVHGVIHAAGITSGTSILAPLAKIDRANSAEQFHPKVEGLYVLEEVLRQRQSDFCLLVSSNTAILGGLGMGPYGAANAFMNAFAASRSAAASSTPWISLCWDGLHADKGNRDSQGHSSLDEYKMSAAECMEAVRRAMCHASPGITVVTSGNLHERLKLWVDRADTPPAEARGKAAGASVARRHASGTITPADGLEKQIADIWHDVLGVDGIGANENFFNLGGNSLTATLIVARLREATGCHLPLRKFFESPTVGQLAKVVGDLQSGSIAAADAPIMKADPESLVNHIEQLSEQDLDAAIQNLLQSEAGK